MLDVRSNVQSTPASRYHLSLAVDDSEIREAQRLRYKVFAEEMGARLSSVLPGHDVDLYDPFCDHLLVRELASGEVVGTYRILPPEAARRVGSYYSEQEFDLTRLNFLRPRMAELGRSCVHPAHRSGAVIARLWIGLADYMMRYGYEYIVGCASIGMADGGHIAASVHRQIDRTPPGAGRMARHAALSPAGRIARRWPDRRAAAADQGLHPAGRDGVRRTGLGSRFQHRRPADAAADGATQPQLCPPLHRMSRHTMRG